MRLTVDFQLPFLKFLFRGKSIQLLGVQFLVESFKDLVRRAVGLNRQFGICSLAYRRLQRLYFQRAVARQRVLQLRDIFAYQRDDKLIVAHVEQAVPQRQIQQFLLPPLQPVFSNLNFRIINSF